LKIFVATLTRNVFGGAESYLRSILPLLAGAGHEITIGYEQEELSSFPTIDEDCFPLVRLTPGGSLPGSASRADVVLLNGMWDASREGELTALLPSVYFSHNFWGTCVSGSKRWGSPRPRVCERPLGVGCLAHYLPHRCGGLNPLVALRLFGNQRSRLAAIIQARALVVASGYMRDEYLKNGVAAERIHVVPYFVQSPAVSAPLPGTGNSESPNQPIRLLFIGRMTPLKGPEYLIRAADALRSCHGRPSIVVLAGDGPSRNLVTREASRLGVPVEDHGWVDPKRRDELIRQATVLVLPSTWPEPFGLVGLEAARLGVPTVAFPVGGIPEWLKPGVNGELAERPADPISLAAAIDRATRSPAHHRALAEAALAQARCYDEATHLRKLLAILEQVAGEPRSAV
jgi:glycosyltransferase involved in cell wall biosynthesis